MVTTPEPNGKTEPPTEKPVDKDDASMAKLAPDDRASLCSFLSDRFTIDELATLAFELGLSHQILPHATTAQLSMALVDHFEQRNNINYLLAEALRQRYDSGMAQLSAKLPTGASYPKVQIILAPGIQPDPDKVVADLAARHEFDADQVQLIGAAWSSLRLLISLPQESARGLLSSGIKTLVNGNHNVISITAFDSLDKADQETWRLIAARHDPWPPVQWNDVAQRSFNHGPLERVLNELRYQDAITFLTWLSDEYLPAPMRELLLQADEKLRAREYQAAHDLCWQAINQVSPNSLSDLSHSSAGHCRVHLGAVYYARGDGFLDAAIEAFGKASKELSYERRAQAVVEFALGATYACKGERTKMYEHVTPEVLSTLKWYPAAKEVDEKWEQIRNRLNALPPAKPEPPEPLPGEGTSGSQPRRDYPKLESSNLPQQRPPLTERIVIPTAIGLIIVVGAILAFVLSQYNPMALFAYGLAVSVATYVIVKRLQCKAPRDCALVIESGGGAKVRWGPTTYYRWPFQERIRALVPLYPLQYTTPEKSFQLGADGKMDFRLMVYYRVNAWNRVTTTEETDAPSSQNGQANDPKTAAKRDEENVLNAVYRVQLENTGAGDRTGPKVDDRSFTADDLRRIWEKRLLKDITATMIEVLPGRTKAGFIGQDVQAHSEIIDAVRSRLKVRVHQWGIEIGDMGILTATASKA